MIVLPFHLSEVYLFNLTVYAFSKNLIIVGWYYALYNCWNKQLVLSCSAWSNSIVLRYSKLIFLTKQSFHLLLNKLSIFRYEKFDAPFLFFVLSFLHKGSLYTSDSALTLLNPFESMILVDQYSRHLFLLRSFFLPPWSRTHTTHIHTYTNTSTHTDSLIHTYKHKHTDTHTLSRFEIPSWLLITPRLIIGTAFQYISYRLLSTQD